MYDTRSRPSGLTPPALRLVLTVWLAVGLALAVRTLVRPESHSVFPVLALGAAHWSAGQPLYSEYWPLDYYRYPPTFMVIAWPLASLGLRLGGVLWGWLNLAVYGAGLWYFVREVLPGRWTSPRLTIFLLLGLFGGLRGLWNGQSNALVTGLLLLGAVGLLRRRWWSAAALLAGAVLIKLTPLAPVLLLCALWPRRLTGRLTAFLLLLLALPFLMQTPARVIEQYRGWAEQCRHLSSERWPGFRDAWTIRQVLTHTSEEMSIRDLVCEKLDSPSYRAVQLLTAAAALAWCLDLRRRRVETSMLLAGTLGVGLGWLLLFGPASEHPTYVCIAPFLAWGVTQRELWPRGRPLLLAAALLILVLGWGSLARAFAEETPWLLLPLPVGCALYLLWLLGVPTYQAALRANNPVLLPTPPSGAVDVPEGQLAAAEQPMTLAS